MIEKFHIMKISKYLFLLAMSWLIGCGQSSSSQEIANPTTIMTIIPSIVETETPVFTKLTVTPSKTPTFTAILAQLPTLTLTPPPIPTLPEIWAMPMNNPDYWVSWSVPVNWWDISSLLPPSTSETLFWNAWSNEQNASTLLSASPSAFPNGLMIVTMEVEPLETVSALSQGTEATNGWGQSVWFRELTGDEALPFNLRLIFSSARPPYYYTFSMNCALPTESDTFHQNAFEALCRHIWNFVSFDFSLCSTPVVIDLDSMMWQLISDTTYKYSFEIPLNWIRASGVTPDTLTFTSNFIGGQPPSCPLPNSQMKLDFSAQPPGNFAEAGQPPLGGSPNLEDFAPITGTNLPVWIMTVENGDGGDLPTSSKLIYIQGTEYWYSLWLSCSPEWTADCESVMSRILDSFQVLP